MRKILYFSFLVVVRLEYFIWDSFRKVLEFKVFLEGYVRCFGKVKFGCREFSYVGRSSRW